MPSIATDCAIAGNTEAAKVNQGGLECSSYTWQVGHLLYGVGNPSCQEDPGFTSPLQRRRDMVEVFINKGLRGQGRVIGSPLTHEGKDQTNE